MKKNLKNVKKFEKVGYFKNPIRVHSEGGKQVTYSYKS